MGRYDVVTHVDSCFLQMLLCERFSIVALKPLEFSAIMMKEVVFLDGSRRTIPMTPTNLKPGDDATPRKQQTSP